MRVIIAGSRNIEDYARLEKVVKESGYDITTVISGTAFGVDRMGERWAHEHKIPIERFPADWKKYGKQAGYLRNVQMAEVADALIALWDGESKGTRHMIDIATRKNLRVFADCKPNPANPGA